jgi:glycerol kinase
VLLAIDQGTTGTTCLVVDEALRPRGRGYREIRQRFPQPGWVEHDPEELLTSVSEAAAEALTAAGIGSRDLQAIGIANQRETTVLWDARTGRAVHDAIVWQDRRTADRCRELPAELVRERTGLVPDPYFSATKLEWLLARYAGDLRFGTVDAWLLWRLSGGEAHVTDLSNASRTMLLSLSELDWDEDLLRLFGVPREVLPALVPSSGLVAEARLLGASVPVTGMAGDQQAALFGQACFAQGEAKTTYGTGSFVLANVGDGLERVPTGVIATVAWRLADTAATYAFEGSVFATGAAVQWLRDGLGLLSDAAESEAMARSLDGNDGVYFVPALTGLGAPHWAPDARGVLCGLTRGTTREHLVRAALEAIAYQTTDVLDAMGIDVAVLRADGGATANTFLMQLQADLAGVAIEVAAVQETTALGAAALAGIGAGVWASPAEVAELRNPAARYEPSMSRDEAASLRAGWRRAVERALV